MKSRSFMNSTLWGAVFMALALFASAVSAQEFRGTVAGSVTDPNGAAVPNATVVIKNADTNIGTTVMTNNEGGYFVPLLQPGSYNITVTAEGFKTFTRQNIQVKVDDRISVDFELAIGTTAEVNIIADTELIERGSVTAGTSVSQRQIAELPLAEGAPYVLATQAPGVVYTGDPNFTGPTANGNLAGFRTNGTAGNQINLDGSPNLAYSGQVAFTPPSDAVQEFKVQTNSFDAQNGFTAGSTVNVALKSGTNKLHGSAYYYDRDKSRTANNFFNNRLGRERPDRKYARYGFVVNGPVWIPGIYNGKDKTFFLGSFERQKDNVAQPTTYSVPTDKMRNGDFTELLVDLTNVNAAANTLIHNPLTGTAAGVTRPTFGCPASGPIPTGSTCNILPANVMYAPALAFLKLFPKANQTGLVNNYVTDQNLIRPYKSYLAKIDHNFNSNNRMFAKWYRSANTEDRYNLEGTSDSITRGFEDRRNNGANVNFTSILTSSWILDIRGSWNQFKLQRYQVGQPTAGDLGFTGIPSMRQDHIFPRFDFRNYMTLGSQRSDWNDGQERPFDLFSFQPTVTQLFGNHSFKYGYDFRRLRERFSTDGYASGRFFIDGTYTMPASNSSSTLRDRAGRDIAAFLLGLPVANTNSLIDNPTKYDARESYHAFFVHDDWRVRPNITLNLGLRYELESGVHEQNGQIVKNFDRTAVSPIAAQVLANYNALPPPNVPIDAFQNLRGGLVFVDGKGDANQTTDKNNYQPRVGFSWGINDKTVIRAGFGIFTQPFQIQTIYQPGFSTPTLFVPSTNNGTSFIATLANPFPNGIAASPGNSLGLRTFLGRDLTSIGNTGPTTTILNYERKNANFTRYMLGIQRELPGGIGVEATYIYSSGKDLAVNRELNAIPTQYLNNFTSSTDPNTILAAITTVNTFLSTTTGINNPFRGLIPDSTAWNGSTIARRRLLTPFPQFGNVSMTEYNGTANFQSFALQFVKRFTKGLSLNGSYTFSRERQTTQYLNPQDTQLTEIVSPNERPHRFTVSSIYELPFGRKRKFGTDWHPVVDAFLGGWQLQGVYEWQSGEPLQFGNVYYNGDPTQLVNRLGQKDPQGRKYGIDVPAFDITGFFLGGVQLAANVPGYGNNYNSGSANVVRSFPLTMSNFRNQRFLKFDVGISKNFRISEGKKFQVRVEAINLLNSPYFSGLNLDPTNAAFGLANTQRQPPRDIQIGGRFTF